MDESVRQGNLVMTAGQPQNKAEPLEVDKPILLVIHRYGIAGMTPLMIHDVTFVGASGQAWRKRTTPHHTADTSRRTPIILILRSLSFLRMVQKQALG